MNLHGIKIGYKHAQMFSSMHQYLQAYTSIYAKSSSPQVTAKASIALMVEVKMYVYSF